MKHEVAYGIIPLKKENDEWLFFLALHTKGNYWGFPKGHPEEGESPRETAARELIEETQLKIVSFLENGPYKEEHRFERNGVQISKEVTYFLAQVEGTPKYQTAEVTEGRWCTLKEALELISFTSTTQLLQKLSL